MAARLQLSADVGSAEFDPNEPCYWKAENHADDNPLRQELWMPFVRELMLPAEQVVIPLTLQSGEAMLRYREELKMYAALRDSGVNTSSAQSSPCPEHQNDCSEASKQKAASGIRVADSMLDPMFLDERAAAMAVEWPKGSTTMKGWWTALEQLRQQIDDSILQLPDQGKQGVFVKLSVRSPKDSSICMPAFYQLLASYIDNSEIHPDTLEALSDDVACIKQASWLALRVHNGQQALQVLLRSDRVYLDILQHQLFNQKLKQQQEQGDHQANHEDVNVDINFNLNVHICQFFVGFNPDWEFRGFVSKGQRTCLTAYSPWTYDPKMVAQKSQLLSVMQGLWDKVPTDKLPMQDFCVDFAVKPDCSQCWIVEINATLPPLAGSGLFQMHVPEDKAIVMNGPFTFRIREEPVKPDDFFIKRTNAKTGQTTTTLMQPAPPEVMLHVYNLRRVKFGLTPMVAKTDAAGFDKFPESDESNKDTPSCVIA